MRIRKGPGCRQGGHKTHSEALESLHCSESDVHLRGLVKDGLIYKGMKDEDVRVAKVDEGKR